MATDKSGRPTFPVWVGSLSEAASERDLRKTFTKFGSIANVKLKTDNSTGKSKGFGWVNFYSREAAETSAAKMAGANVRGSQIKTSGPAELERKGLFSPPKLDFRPLTDCSFFIQGKHCKNGDACVYRHSVQALSTEAACIAWQRKQCTDKDCPWRHPGGSGGNRSSRKSNSSSAGSPTPEIAAASGGGGGVQVCGGRCGDPACSLSFSSSLTLTQHIQLGQLHCTTCNIVCASQVELREHRKFCPRTHHTSGSTATPSSSSDVEILSDSDSETSEDSFPLSHPRGRDHTHHSPTTLAKSEAMTGEGGKRGRRGRRGGKNKRNKVGVSGSSSAPNFSQTPKKTSFSQTPGSNNYSPPSGVPPYSPTSQHGPGDVSGVSFDIGSSDSSDESSDEDDLMYTSAEMAQLLSLNEQDMHPYSSDSGGEEEEEEEEGRVEGGRKEDGEVNIYLGKKKRVRKKKAHSESRGESASSTPTGNPSHQSTRPSPQRTLVHARQPEPVGLFWDIENCSVPVDKSAFGVAAKMRRVFFEGKREAEFMVVCDITKERKEVTDTLNRAQVTLVHVNAVAKNAADDKLRQSLRRFAHTYPAPSTVVLVSSDVNFSSELNDLRHVHNMTIVLVHSRFTSEALKVFAQQLVSYEQFLEDVEGPKVVTQHPSLPNILLVTNLPKHMPPKKLSSRLGQLSDNCGGRVLGVDLASGTARVLFRTPEWAMKAEKRMKGEDVFGYKINVCLDYSQFQRPQQPPHPPAPHLPPLQQPPHPLAPHPPPQRPLQQPPHPPPQRPPQPPHLPQGLPLPRRPPPFLPPSPSSPHNFRHLSGSALGNTFPPAAHLPPNHPPMPTSPPLQRPPHTFEPRPLFPTPPNNVPLLSPPRGPPSNVRFPPPLNFPPPPRQPTIPMGATPYSKMAALPPPRPEGKILIFKIPAATDGKAFEELDRQVLMLVLEACFKTERQRVVMWHSYTEMQVLLRLDYHGSAVVRRDDLVRTLWEKGDLKPNVAEKFLEQCVKSLSDLCAKRRLPWQVTSCGWSEDEEADRLTRSQVIALLRKFPLFWVKWNRFKTIYNKTYHCALSEMAVHTTCKGAVMILGKADNNQSQVIICYEMSPLVRISAQKKVCSAVLVKVIAMLSARPQHRIKLLDVVRELTNEVGPLPISACGRPLQEVLAGSPQLQFVGSKPSSICLTLVTSPPPATERSIAPPTPHKNTRGGDLDTLSAEFRHLLQRQSPNPELPLSRLQQEYQTLYHHSFRVADYVPTAAGEGGKMKTLVDACSGIKVKEVKLPNNKTESIVYLAPETKQIQSKSLPIPQQNIDSVADCERRVHDLLCDMPDYQITLDRFMGEYEKKYGHKMSYYGHSRLTNLMESFSSTITVSDMKGPTRLIRLQPIHILTHELTLLLSAHNGQLAINQIVPEYKEMFGRSLVLSEYGFSKLIKALEAMADTIRLTGKGASRVAVLKKKSTPSHSAAATQQFVEEVTVLLTSTHTKKLSVIQLMKDYNEVFRNPAKLPLLSVAEMVDTLKIIPAFSLSGAGPVQYVNLVQQNDNKEKKKKEKTKVAHKQQELPNLEPALPQPSSQQASAGMVEAPVQRSDPSPPTQHLTRPHTPPTPPTPPASPLPSAPPLSTIMSLSGGSSNTAGDGDGCSGPVIGSTEHSDKGEGSIGSVLHLNEKESQRLASETQRLLLCHHEHAMTVSELVLSFTEAGDPARPSAEELHLCLHKHNVRRGGAKSPRIFQISSIASSVGDSLVQLNQADCYAKLSMDLLHLFVYQPNPQLTLPVTHMSNLYQRCHRRKLVPVVYGMRTFEGVIEDAKHISQLMKLDETRQQLCSLTDLGCCRVMSSLLVELLFLRGEECCNTASDLPRLFQEHFGFPLPLSLLKVDSPTALLALHEIHDCIQVTGDRPVLKDVTRFAEQLRFLLTQNNGRLPLDTLQGCFISAFGTPPDTDGRDWLSTKLIHYAPHVVNLTGNKWVVWAPAGKPYPPRQSAKSLSSSLASYRSASSQGSSVEAHQEWTSLPSVSREEDLLVVEESVEVGEGEVEMGESGHGVAGAVSVDGRVGTQLSALFPSPPAKTLVTTPVVFGAGPNPPAVTHADANSPVTESGGFMLSPELCGKTSPPEEQQIAPFGLPPPRQFFNGSQDPPVFLPPKSTDSHSSARSDREKVVECDASPYGFLEKDQELLAKVTVKEEDGETLSTAEALQQLIEAGKPSHDFLIPDLPPPLLPVPTLENESPHRESDIPVDGTADYLEAGLKPDEVLQELYRVKESGGGVINPASMEPFLSYFGELSSRELERLESQQAKKSKTPPAPSPTPTKGQLRNKRMMAIRFPGQDPDPSDLDPELQKTLQLPEIPSLSDQSDDDSDPGCPLRPITRAEILRKLLKDEDHLYPFSSDDVTSGRGSGSSPPPPPGRAVETGPESGHPARPPLSYPHYYEQGQQ